MYTYIYLWNFTNVIKIPLGKANFRLLFNKNNNNKKLYQKIFFIKLNIFLVFSHSFVKQLVHPYFKISSYKEALETISPIIHLEGLEKQAGLKAQKVFSRIQKRKRHLFGWEKT